MIKSARVLRCGLLFFVFCFSIFSASIPTHATTSSDTVSSRDRSQVHIHARHGLKPKAASAGEPSSYFSLLWQKPKDAVKNVSNWFVASVAPVVTSHMKGAVNSLIDWIKPYTFLSLILAFFVLVISAYIGTSFAVGSFVRKLYKIVERLNPASKPVFFVLDERKMKVINPEPKLPVLEKNPNNVVQLEMKKPAVVEIEPSPKGGRKSRAGKKAA